MGQWNPDLIPNLHGMRAIVTGSNSGIGRSTARELARKGATVVLACRDLAKATTCARRHPRGRAGCQCRDRQARSGRPFQRARICPTRVRSRHTVGHPDQQRRPASAQAADIGRWIGIDLGRESSRPLCIDRPAPSSIARRAGGTRRVGFRPSRTSRPN